MNCYLKLITSLLFIINFLSFNNNFPTYLTQNNTFNQQMNLTQLLNLYLTSLDPIINKVRVNLDLNSIDLYNNILLSKSVNGQPYSYNLNNKDISQWQVYFNKDYGIMLKYPLDWKPNSKYSNRYDGNNGFFQISAIIAQGLSIDKVAELDVNHLTKPYGSNPKIQKLNIDNQEAILIMPSSDQEKEMNTQAELIVRYKNTLKLNNEIYEYFVLWSDKNHIAQISNTIKFIYK